MLYLRKKEKGMPYLFLLPALAFILFIFLSPVATVLYDSLFRIQGSQREFIGVENYAALAGDSLFWIAITNNLKLFLCIPVLVLGSLLFSVILFYRIPGWRVYRILVLVPYILSITVVGIAFDYILREDGLLNLLLNAVGLGSLAQPWLGQSGTALWAVMGVVIWKELGFGIVLFLARLLSVDESVLEAAKLDGASVFATTRRILLPELRGVMTFYVVFSMINMLSWMFNYIFVMTRGGPVNSTYILEYYIYQLGIRYRQYGLSSALAVILLVLAVVLVVAQALARRYLLREKEDEEA